MYHDVASLVEDFAVLFDFWKEGEASEEEVKEACNLANTAGNFRLAVQPANALLATKHYIAYDTVIPALDTISLTIGMSLATTDVVSVYAQSNVMSFNLFGSEIT
jgi:hypothetical protein